MHTVFSDGDVWPTVRVQEAWRDGLDVIALTDHIEYLRYQQDIPVAYGRSAEVARAEAESLGIMVIRAAEITRGEPPGHLNTLFLSDVAALNQKEYRVALKNAFDQGAFIFWNHPGWKQPDNRSVWYAEQGEFLTNGWLRGIEIVNGTDYDPIAHQWCLDKKLALVGGSDLHGPASFEYAARARRHSAHDAGLCESPDTRIVEGSPAGAADGSVQQGPADRRTGVSRSIVSGIDRDREPGPPHPRQGPGVGANPEQIASEF